MYEKDISIIIVNYNVKDFLYKCLESIYKAIGNLNVETIVIDNDSLDGSVEYLEPIFPKVNFVSVGKNIGFGNANNLGFQIAKGKYILILNPDTIIEENNLKIMYDYMEKNPQIGIAGCKVLNPDGSFQLPCRRGFPTPWASFCKLFGLQKIFPKSRLFAQYNQTFRSIDETYYIDAVIGAYMFTRADLIEELKGFDPDFFMYGEDIDLCYRAKRLGFEVAYLHTTTIIHYKGKSTKRSSINDVKHFYNAMEIFAKKHYGSSSSFLLFLRLGIFFRSIIAYLKKYFEEIIYIFLDVFIVNIGLVVGSYIKFNTLFGFPNYAYPLVFIVVSFVLIVSMIMSGEYFENRHTLAKSSYGVLIHFFIISALTYFFKDYAFSRGAILVMTGIALIFIPLLRLLLLSFSKLFGSQKDKNILIVGLNDQGMSLIYKLIKSGKPGAVIKGFISIEDVYPTAFNNYEVLGNINYLGKVIEKNKISTVIITEKNLSRTLLMKIISESQYSKAKYYLAAEYDDIITSEIIENVTGRQFTTPEYPISLLRNKIIKRFFDIFISTILLTLGLPFLLILLKNRAIIFKQLVHVLIGDLSLVGYLNINDKKYILGKEGMTGLPHINQPQKLSEQIIDDLNEYYLRNYSLLLDVEILSKALLRK